MSIGVIGTNPDRVAKLSGGFLVIAALREDQSHIVVRLGIIRPQANRLTELGQNLVGVRPLASEQESEHVVRFRNARILGRSFTQGSDCPVPVGRGKNGIRIESRVKLGERSLQLVQSKENNSQIDEVGGGGR